MLFADPAAAALPGGELGVGDRESAMICRRRASRWPPPCRSAFSTRLRMAWASSSGSPLTMAASVVSVTPVWSGSSSTVCSTS
ncbi:hypothetical protein [Streptomyces violascens]|uniref:hypothetical protein n=1 Tax=Streptomyces violascens TaxID=67381 RepID=UPI001E4081FB|nr:hypothetical protein [Streptomyces violascens]